MPGLYHEAEYDLAGFIVGAVEKKHLLTGAKITPDDMLIGLASTDCILTDIRLPASFCRGDAHGPDTWVPELNATIGDELLRVHRSYLKPIQTLMKAGMLKGAAHITGGGLTDNTPRMLPDGLSAEINLGSWPVLPIFEYLGTSAISRMTITGGASISASEWSSQLAETRPEKRKTFFADWARSRTASEW